MALILNFEILGEKQLMRGLTRFTQNIKDFSTLWPKLRKQFYEMEKKQFSSEGNYGSAGWAPLSPNYAKYKARKFPGRPILVRTGALKAELTGGGVYRASRDMMEVGAGKPYGIFHQKGGKNLPIRKPIEMSESEKMQWHRLTHIWLIAQERASF